MKSRVARVVARQHGTINRRQLLAIGFTRHQIDEMLLCGHLHRIHLGVYAVGHRCLSREGNWMAAVLAGGRGSALSHIAAGTCWKALALSPGLIDVTCPNQHKGRPGIRFYRSHLEADEIVRRDGIPVTSLPRTLVDLAAVLEPFALERALAEAEFHHRALMRRLPDALNRYTGRRGMVKLRRVAATGNHKLGVTRYPLEERFLRFLDAHGFARPELNAPLRLDGRRIEIDCLWRAAGIALELDGRDGHDRDRTFHSDRARDLQLAGLGYTAARVTSPRLRAPVALARDLAAIGVPTLSAP